jgi:hypothetical protein
MDIEFQRTVATMLYVSNEAATRKQVFRMFRLLKSPNRLISDSELLTKWKKLLLEIANGDTNALAYGPLNGIMTIQLTMARTIWNQEVLHLPIGYFDEAFLA